MIENIRNFYTFRKSLRSQAIERTEMTIKGRKAIITVSPAEQKFYRGIERILIKFGKNKSFIFYFAGNLQQRPSKMKNIS